MAGLVIPVEERFGRLKESLLGFAEALDSALKQKPNLLAAQPRDSFWSLSLPWLIELEMPNPSEGLIKVLDARKAEISKIGYDGSSIAKELLRVKLSDGHLAECCPTLPLLARHLSRNFLYAATTLLDAGSGLDSLGNIYNNFVKMTYEQGRFRRSSFTHVFNLEIEGRELEIGGLKIVRLNPDFKGLVLGEKTPTPFLHPSGVGDCFIYANEGATGESDDNWLQTKRSVDLPPKSSSILSWSSLVR